MANSPTLSSNDSKRPLIGLTTYRKIAEDSGAPLYGLMRSYVDAVAGAGGIPLLIPLGLDTDDLFAILERVDGLILPGGGDIDPEAYRGSPHELVRGIDDDRDRVEINLARKAVKTEKPFLAICRGHQVLNVALGGTMWEDLASQMPGAIRHDYNGEGMRTDRPHTVQLRKGSRLAAILNSEVTSVNSLHHQGLRDLAPELTVSATAPDGLVEGVEIEGHPFAVGVQWHPENLVNVDPAMHKLFVSLVEASANTVY
ncbi:MAG: gamma-glutamyl-gamma-aminobutyrate hydrolase family protein [Candidatus Promineifilaceae bacterium]|jgi:putative glutamine amidotransferase